MPLPTHFKLSDGVEIPATGLGTYHPTSEGVPDAVEAALKMGYRHLDCARMYPTEPSVGIGLGRVMPGLIPREEIFITTKIWNTSHRPEHARKSLEESLKALGTDYVDLLLVHWPFSFRPQDEPGTPVDEESGEVAIDEGWTLVQTWRGLEGLVESGEVRALGVSNFMPKHLVPILRECRIRPVVNQVECHVWAQQKELLEYCEKEKILLTAYAPLGHITTGKAGPVDKIGLQKIENIAHRLSKEHGSDVSASQVMLSWNLQRGVSVIPKSFSEERMKTNMAVLELTKEDMEEIATIDRGEAGRHHGAEDFGKPMPKWAEEWLRFGY